MLGIERLLKLCYSNSSQFHNQDVFSIAKAIFICLLHINVTILFIICFFFIYLINFVYILCEETSKEVHLSSVLSNLSFARAM